MAADFRQMEKNFLPDSIENIRINYDTLTLFKTQVFKKKIIFIISIADVFWDACYFQLFSDVSKFCIRIYSVHSQKILF